MYVLPLVSLVLISFAPGPAPRPVRGAGIDPPIRIWVSSDGEFTYAERAKVFIQAAEDGYVVVLHVDTRGRIRILRPLDPDGDHYVRAGKTYEVTGYDDREAFIVDDTAGHGLVFAAFARNRFLLEKLARDGHWDYQALAVDSSDHDPELAVFDKVRVIQPSGGFSYDADTYIVYDRREPGWYLYPRLRHPRPTYPRPAPWPWWLPDAC